MTDKAAEQNAPVVTEADLLKSLQELEGKPAPVVEPAAPVVETPAQAKFADTVATEGSTVLAKALDVSPVLDEMTTLLGAHVDRLSETFGKSIQAAAERDLSLVGVLQGLKKSIDDNTAALEELRKLPQPPAGSRVPRTDASQVLHKSTTGSQELEPTRTNPALLRKAILDGLQANFMKASKAEERGEAARLQKAITMFETSGKLSDSDMAAALAAAK